MRKLELWLVLGLVVACGDPPPEVTTDVTATDSSPTSGPPTSTLDDTTGNTTVSASTGEQVCPPMPPEEGGYDPCPGLCGGGGQCFNDGAEYAVCTRGCFMDCNCWAAPDDGDAPARCSGELLESTSVCVLDCSGGQTCPRGMFCVRDLGICAFPYPGSETTTDVSTETDGSSSSGSTDEGGSTDTSTGTTDLSTGTTDLSTGTTDPSTGTTDTSTGTTDLSTGTTDLSTGTTDPSTGGATGTGSSTGVGT